MGTGADFLRGGTDMRHHGGQRFTHLVEAAGQLADLVVAGHVEAHAQVARAQCIGLANQLRQRTQLAAQQPDSADDGDQHGQQATDGQLGADAPGHFADFTAWHAGDDCPATTGERLADAVEVVAAFIPELCLARFACKVSDSFRGTVEGFDARRRNQPGALLIEQCQRAGRADAEALQVIELGFLCIGVIESYKQRGNDLAAAVANRAVLRHVVAIKQHRFAYVALTGHQTLIGSALAIQHGADGARTILFAQRGADTNEVVAAAHEYRRDACGHRTKFVDFGKVVVQGSIAQIQAWGLGARDRNRFVGLQGQAAGEALLEQAAQALGAVAQCAVKGAELIGQQPGFARHVFFANDQIGCVQRPQSEQRTAADNNCQDHRQSNTELRGNSGTGLGHRDSTPNDWSRRVRGLPFS
ncbi:Unknown protein sequence [Pseudomonas syringae pv. maculicola str. M6]|nr:Unknown protein sequence [Pseudomonas syringae pv. maculicola str. M6]